AHATVSPSTLRMDGVDADSSPVRPDLRLPDLFGAVHQPEPVGAAFRPPSLRLSAELPHRAAGRGIPQELHQHALLHGPLPGLDADRRPGAGLVYQYADPQGAEDADPD